MNTACRRFRTAFEPGDSTVHRSGCPACDAFARTVELARAGGARLPLSAGLEDRLRALALPEPAGSTLPELPLPLPSLPLPEGLEARLEAIGRGQRATARPPLPAWVRSPAASLAASLAAVVLCGALWGDPVARTEPLAGALGERWTEVERQGREGWVHGVLLPAHRTVDRTLNRSRQAIASLREELEQLKAAVENPATPELD